MADIQTNQSVMDKMKTYIRTRKGTILAAETLLSFIVIICYLASSYGGLSALAICEMVFAILFFAIFMMELDKQLQAVNWLWTDLFRAGIGALLYIISSLFCVIGGAGDAARMAGGVFGLVAGILFSYDTYTIFSEIKSTRGRSAVSTDA